MTRRQRASFLPLVTDFAEHYRGKVEDWRLTELAELYQDAEGRLLELDTERQRRLSEPLEAPLSAEESSKAYEVTPAHAELVAEAVRVARTTTQFEVASPGDVSPALLRAMLDLPQEAPLSAHYAVLALTAAIMAAEWPERADRYLGAAREAVTLANAADLADEAAEAKRGNVSNAATAKVEQRRQRVAAFAELWRELRPTSRNDSHALDRIRRRMDAGRSTVESYLREAKAAGLLVAD